MNKFNCICHKLPCICESSSCQTEGPEKIEFVDKNGKIHHIESIYKKISLKDLRNKEKKYEQQHLIRDLSQISQPEALSAKLSSIEGLSLNGDFAEDTSNCNDCSECCEHACARELPINNSLSKKRYISAELYCIMNMRNAELGQIVSKLSSDEDGNGEESSDYETAPGKSDEDDEESTYFNESVPYSKEEGPLNYDPTCIDSNTQNEKKWKIIHGEKKIKFGKHNNNKKNRHIKDEDKSLPNSHNTNEIHNVNIPEEKILIAIHPEGNKHISENNGANQNRQIENDANTMYRFLPNSHNTTDRSNVSIPDDDKINRKKQLTEHKKKKQFQKSEDEKSIMLKSTPSTNSTTNLHEVNKSAKKKCRSHDLLMTREEFRDLKRRNPLSLIELTSNSQKKKCIIIANIVSGNQSNNDSATSSSIFSGSRMESLKSEKIEMDRSSKEDALQEQGNKDDWVPVTSYEKSIAYICRNFQKSPQMKRLEELKTNLKQKNDILLTEMKHRQNLYSSSKHLLPYNSVTLLNKSRATRIPVKTKKKYEHVPNDIKDENIEFSNTVEPNVKPNQQPLSKISASTSKIVRNIKNSSKCEDRAKQLITSYRRSQRKKHSKKQTENRLLQNSRNVHIETLSMSPEINIEPKTQCKNYEQITRKKKISETEIHICIKESSSHLFTNKHKSSDESKNILQTVSIDVTPKNSESIRINVMPTVPEINNDGIITIPVQFKIIQEEKGAKEEKQHVVPNVKSKDKLLYQENQESYWCENYMVRLKRDMIGEITPLTSPEECANLLWPQMKEYLLDPNYKHEPVLEYDNNEIQTNTASGPKLLSKSLNSIASNSSVLSLKIKSEPVAKYGIQMNDVILPQANSIAIRNVVPSRKSKRRFTNDNNKMKDNNLPSTLGAIPPSEEIKVRNDTDSVNKTNLSSRLIKQRQQEEPSLPEEEVFADEESTEKEVNQVRSKFISLVFSESFCDKDQQTLQQDFVQEENDIGTSKVNIQWPNIVLPINPQIAKTGKVNISTETSTTITDLSTDEYNSINNTYSNLPEDVTPSDKCDNKISIDKQTNTLSSNKSSKQELNKTEEEILHIQEPSTTNKMTEMLKAFKEDPVLAAFKAFEEELKPVRKALAEVQTKLRALNLPELQCIFRQDENLDFADNSRSNSQFGTYIRPHGSSWATDRALPCIRRPLSCNNKSSYCSQRPSSSMRRSPSELFEHENKFVCNVKVCHCKTPPARMHPRPLSTDLWTTFGSCERNTVKGPYEKRFQQNIENDFQTHEICSYHQRCCSRASSSRTDYRSVSFDTPENRDFNNIQNYDNPYFPNNLDELIDYENLDCTPRFRNITTCPYLYSQQQCYNDPCRNSSSSSLHTSISENSNQNHLLTRRCSSRYMDIQCDTNSRYLPVKLRPVTHCCKYDKALSRHNSADSSGRNTTVEFKNGVVYMTSKIKLPNSVHKHETCKHKDNMNIYTPDNQRNSYTHLEYNDYHSNQSSANYDHSHPCANNYNIRSHFHENYLEN